MEKMPFQAEMANAVTMAAPAMQPTLVGVAVPPPSVTTSDWRQGLPVLTSSRVTLRDLRLADAPALFSMLSSEEITRFISPPPTSVEGFERFIGWALRERDAGNYICFAVV